MPGPIPNRSEDLARPRSRKGSDQQEVTKGIAMPVDLDRWEADPEWHEIAVNLFDSLKASGQSKYYQESDWAIAYSLCEDLSHYKQGSKGIDKETGEIYNKPRSGQMLQAIMTQLSNLLVTEGDRRRVRIELEEPEVPTTPAAVLAIDNYKERLKKPSS